MLCCAIYVLYSRLWNILSLLTKRKHRLSYYWHILSVFSRWNSDLYPLQGSSLRTFLKTYSNFFVCKLSSKRGQGPALETDFKIEISFLFSFILCASKPCVTNFNQAHEETCAKTKYCTMEFALKLLRKVARKH